MYLGFQIPNLDGTTHGRAQPVLVGREAHGVDDVASIERGQVLALVQVPQHGHAVLAARGAQGAVRRHSDGVDIALVALQVVVQFAGCQAPHFDQLIPASRHDQGRLHIGREAHARHPFLMTVILQGVLELTEAANDDNNQKHIP